MGGMKSLLGDTPYDQGARQREREEADTHAQNLNRVFSKISPLIMDFARTIAAKPFTMKQLTDFVRETEPNIAPDSPGRILRDMRQARMLDYVLISRRNSTYKFIIR